MSGIINKPIARAPRQNGLKKPRPLRSVSLQETHVNTKQNLLERQSSSEYPSHSTTQKIDQEFSTNSTQLHLLTDLGCVDGFQYNLPSEKEESFRQGEWSPPGNHEALPRGFQRQNSATSQDSSSTASLGHSRRSSFGSSTSPPSVTTRTAEPFLDANDNKVIGSSESEISARRSQSNEESRAITSIHQNLYGEDLKGERKNGEHITIATLLTPKKQQLVLSGTCIQTVLNACKVLLQDMGVSIDRLQTVENPAVKRTDAVAPDSPTECRPLPSSSLRYAKKELLALSESKLSRKPPAMWNILASTHSDCCIPASELLEYFEPIDFHLHDGTLVKGDKIRWE